MLFAEDRMHEESVCRMTDAVLRARTSWLADHDDLTPFRHWHVDDEARLHGRQSMPLSGGRRRFAEGRRPRAHGHFGGEAAEPDARLMRECLLFARREGVEVAFIARDMDSQDRAAGLGQAIARDSREHSNAIGVVAALANPEVEAWAIVTWEPKNDADRERLQALRQRLGFDPIENPARLSSKRETTSLKNTKVIAEALGVAEVSTDISHLTNLARKPAAEDCGLSRFLSDLDRVVLPLFVGGHS